MSNLPKGAKKVTYEPGPSLPKGAVRVGYEGPTPEEAATMPTPEPSRTERVLEYLRNTPGRIAETATSANTIPSAMTGATLGALPRLSAAIDTVPAVVRWAVGDGANVGAEYDRNLRRIKPLYDEAVEKEPVANFVGMAASPNPLSKSGAAGRVMGAAGAGALEQYMGTDGPRALDAAGNGSLVAAGLQTAAEGAPGVLRPIAKGLRNAAGEKAVQAVGARAGITDRLAQMGISPDDVPELGNKFLDEGLVPSGLGFSKPLEQTKKRAEALRQAAGQRVGAAIKQADASGASFDPMAAQSSMRAKMNIANPLESENAGKANKLVDLVGDLAPQGEYAAADSFAQANKMKSQAWNGADFRQDTKMSPELYRKAVGGLRDDIGRQVGAATSPDVEAGLAAANRQFGTASKAETLSGMALSRDVQKQQFSLPRAMITSAAGAGVGAFGGPGGAGVGALLAPMATQALVSRGPNVAANAYRLGSKGAEGLAEQTVNPSMSVAAGSALQDFLTPMDDEERQKKAAAAFTKGTGG